MGIASIVSVRSMMHKYRHRMSNKTIDHSMIEQNPQRMMCIRSNHSLANNDQLHMDDMPVVLVHH